MKTQFFTEQEKYALSLSSQLLHDYIDHDLICKTLKSVGKNSEEKWFGAEGKLLTQSPNQDEIVELVDLLKTLKSLKREIPEEVMNYRVESEAYIENFIKHQDTLYIYNQYKREMTYLVNSSIQGWRPNKPVEILKDQDLWYIIEIAWVEPVVGDDDSQSLNYCGLHIIESHLKQICQLKGGEHKSITQELNRIKQIPRMPKITKPFQSVDDILGEEYDKEMGSLRHWSYQTDPQNKQVFYRYVRSLIETKNYRDIFFKITILGDKIDYRPLWDPGEKVVINQKHEILSHFTAYELYSPQPIDIFPPEGLFLNFNFPYFNFDEDRLYDKLVGDEEPAKNFTEIIRSCISRKHGDGDFEDSIISNAVKMQQNYQNSEDYENRYLHFSGKQRLFGVITQQIVSLADMRMDLDDYSIELDEKGTDLVVDQHYLDWKEGINTASINLDLNRLVFPILTRPDWIIEMRNTISSLDKYSRELQDVLNAVNKFIQTDTARLPILLQLINEAGLDGIHSEVLRKQCFKRLIELGDHRKMSTIKRQESKIINQIMKNIRDCKEYPEIEVNEVLQGKRGPKGLHFRYRI